MIDRCTNPECRRELRYLRDGKVYLFAMHTQKGGTRKEHFWLCGECCKTMVLTCINGRDVKIVSRAIEDSAKTNSLRSRFGKGDILE